MWFLILSLTGCLSYRNLQTAQPLGKGHTQVGVDIGRPILAAEGGAASIVTTPVTISVRTGVADRVDLLVEASSQLGVGLGLKATLTEPESPVAVALAPRLFGGTVFVASVGQASLPVLVGIPIGEHELTLGPRVDYYGVSALGGDDFAGAGITSVGSSASIALKAGPVQIIPEITVNRFVSGVATVAGESDTAVFFGESPWWIQPNLALLFSVGGGGD